MKTRSWFKVGKLGLKVAGLAVGTAFFVSTIFPVDRRAQAGSADQEPPGNPGGVKEGAREIRALLDKQVEAWNHRNLDGFMNGYWHSPDLTFFSGSSRVFGWQSTIDRYRQRYQSAGNEMGRLDFSELQVEVLGQDAAFVRGKWHLKMSASDTGGWFTLVFKRFPDGWKIIHDHTSS